MMTHLPSPLQNIHQYYQFSYQFLINFFVNALNSILVWNCHCHYEWVKAEITSSLQNLCCWINIFISYSLYKYIFCEYTISIRFFLKLSLWLWVSRMRNNLSEMVELVHHFVSIFQCVKILQSWVINVINNDEQLYIFVHFPECQGPLSWLI